MKTYFGPAHRFPMDFPKHIPAGQRSMILSGKMAETMNKRTYFGERLFFGRTLKRANKIVCVSHSTARDLLEFFPHYADKIPSFTRAPINILAGQIIKASPLHFCGYDGTAQELYRLIDAYAAMPHKDVLDLVIVGGAGWGVKLQELVNQRQLKDHVRIITQANDVTVNQLYADCHFLVMPSLYEGFGLPLVETMKFGNQY